MSTATRPHPANEVAEEVAWLVEGGSGLAAITHALGIKDTGIQQALYRAGRADRWRAIRPQPTNAKWDRRNLR